MKSPHDPQNLWEKRTWQMGWTLSSGTSPSKIALMPADALVHSSSHRTSNLWMKTLFSI